ncbi:MULTISPECIES: DUF3304 domain-containing protein [unclassified Pseudomonas]|uniref:DUF3304 domain-containing protein n=1 Tax=unclassified Pseudomonas TaxID=196821 RepID=UPI002AB43BFE|nr:MULTISPECIES: DUF3304 domain-containing protein [unclassified Pseudomonas]MDY7562401.1 DUF3304 domain-containing protein [Pseudomonas sp. AB6]
MADDLRVERNDAASVQPIITRPPRRAHRGLQPHLGGLNYFMVNGNGGPNIGPYGGGGSQNCCVTLPRQWHPGLTVVVEWEKDPTPHAYADWPEPRFSDAWHVRMKKEKTNNTRHRAVVEVAPYEVLGVVDVHFLPCDQVAVSAVAATPGHAKYPFSYPSKMEEPAVCPAP